MRNLCSRSPMNFENNPVFSEIIGWAMLEVSETVVTADRTAITVTWIGMAKQSGSDSSMLTASERTSSGRLTALNRGTS